MPINPFSSVAIIEQKRLVSLRIDKKTAEKTVQLVEKLVPFCFVKADDPIPVVLFDSISIFLEFASNSTVQKTFA